MRILYAVAALCALTSVSNAQEFRITSLDCASGIYGQMGVFGQAGMIAYVLAPSPRPLVSEEYRTQLLDAIFKESMKRCEGKPRVGIMLAYINVEGGNAFVAGKTAKEPIWKIISNELEQRIAALDKKEAEARAREQAQLDAANTRESFAKANGIASYVIVDQLKANPFAFKDKIVGIRVSFSNMTSEKEGIFETVVLFDVPAVKFTVPGQQMVVAMKMTGTRPMPTLFGQTPAPVGQYINHYVCKFRNCSDFYGSN